MRDLGRSGYSPKSGATYIGPSSTMGPDVTSVTVQVAERFARLLDGRDYHALVELLSADCEYECRGGMVCGSAAIVEEYRRSTEWAFDVLDRIDFSSTIDFESPNTAKVTFFDYLRLGSEVHRHTCQQILTTNENSQIKRIVHVDLPGEKARLEAFFEECGIKRPRS
jgi:hypothetical protein